MTDLSTFPWQLCVWLSFSCILCFAQNNLVFSNLTYLLSVWFLLSWPKVLSWADGGQHSISTFICFSSLPVTSSHSFFTSYFIFPTLPLPHPTWSVRYVYMWGKERNFQVCGPAALLLFLFSGLCFKALQQLEHLGVTIWFYLRCHVSDLGLSRRFGLFRKDVVEGGNPSPTDWAHTTVVVSESKDGSKQGQCYRKLYVWMQWQLLVICNFGLVWFTEMSVVQFPDR